MNISLLRKWNKDFASQFSRRLTSKEKERFLDKIEEELQVRNYESERVKVKRWGFTNRLLSSKCEKPKVGLSSSLRYPNDYAPGHFYSHYAFWAHQTNSGIDLSDFSDLTSCHSSSLAKTNWPGSLGDSLHGDYELPLCNPDLFPKSP